MIVPTILLALTVRASMMLHLDGSAQAAFSMFDPVNESRWDPDWKPQLLGSRVQQGLVFLVRGDQRGPSTWLLDLYNPRAGVIRYVVNSRDSLDEIDIKVVPNGPSQSTATVTYTRTSLNAAADKKLLEFHDHFTEMAPHWESAINAALRTP